MQIVCLLCGENTAKLANIYHNCLSFMSKNQKKLLKCLICKEKIVILQTLNLCVSEPVLSYD